MSTKRNVGVLAKVDGLGRATIPKSTRRRLGIYPGTMVLFAEDDQKIVLQKYYPEDDLKPCLDTAQSILDEMYYMQRTPVDADVVNHLQELLDQMRNALKQYVHTEYREVDEP